MLAQNYSYTQSFNSWHVVVSRSAIAWRKKRVNTDHPISQQSACQLLIVDLIERDPCSKTANKLTSSRGCFTFTLSCETHHLSICSKNTTICRTQERAVFPKIKSSATTKIVRGADSRSLKVIPCCANQRGIYRPRLYDFLLAPSSNLTSIFNRS